MRRGQKGDRGATLVEAGISYMLLFLALFAIVEFGLAFKDWLSVSHAAREGARAGATLGTDPGADHAILREIEEILSPVGLPTGSPVRVFEAKPGGDATTYTYDPGNDCVTSVTWTGTPNPLPGCCDWSPCPQPGRPTYVEPLWAPPSRDVEAPLTDRVGIEITYTHNWVTGFFTPSTDFTSQADFQLEPEVFAPTP